MSKPFIKYDGTGSPPAFFDSDLVEVEYRNGVRRQGTRAWMFAGWNHHGTSTDILKYRVL